jgi:maltose alpha-D-glucosyltransferase/alpha-amylase
LLNWSERVIRMRKECPEISWGDFTILRTNAPDVLAIRYDWRKPSILTLHNFADASRKVRLKVGGEGDGTLVVFDRRHSRAYDDGAHRVALEPYAWRWFRVGGTDNILERSDLNIKDDRVLS